MPHKRLEDGFTEDIFMDDQMPSVGDFIVLDPWQFLGDETLQLVHHEPVLIALPDLHFSLLLDHDKAEGGAAMAGCTVRRRCSGWVMDLRWSGGGQWVGASRRRTARFSGRSEVLLRQR
ncbi:hypothetical protein Dimus_001881 [Dionaea muscipula]